MATDAQRLRYASVIINAMSRGSGPGTPCSRTDFSLWTSALATDRLTATKLCAGCTILQSCGQQAVANKTTSGVWGGRDYGP
jgi:hypothetical protein